jgi:replicative DNA helicase
MKDLESRDAERSLLAGLIHFPDTRETVTRIVESGHLFYEMSRETWRLLADLDAEGPVDVNVVLLAMGDRGFHRFGGADSAALLPPDRIPVPEAMPRLAAQIRDLALRRAYREAGDRIKALAEAGGAPEALARQVDAILGDLQMVAPSSEAGWHSFEEVLRETAATLDRRIADPVGEAPLAYGYADLDGMLCSRPGHMVVIGARPKVGKTDLALNFVLNMATRLPVGFLSLEMSRWQLVERALSREADTDGRNIGSGRLSVAEQTRIGSAYGEMAALQIWIDDQPGVTMGVIRSKVRTLKKRCPDLKVVVLDYLQLCGAPPGRNATREQVVSEISRGLKLLAREFGVLVIALAQVNRKAEDRTVKKPAVSDLRESGAIEQDADAVLLLHREDVYDKDSDNAGICEVIIGANRHGPSGTVKLAYDGSRHRFRSLADVTRFAGNPPRGARAPHQEDHDDDGWRA